MEREGGEEGNGRKIEITHSQKWRGEMEGSYWSYLYVEKKLTDLKR